MFNLKYLFEAEFEDGSVIKQNKKDVSEIDPRKSQFYDVLHCEKKIKRFSLCRLFDKWSVNLKTGVFTHNGVHFQVEEVPQQGERILEFFRQHQHDFNPGLGKETDHRTVYFLGYSIKGKKFLVGVK